jgi:PhoPQ-activated pathogenicity-related protein
MSQRLIRQLPTAPTLPRDSAVRTLSCLAFVSLLALTLPRHAVGKEAVAEAKAAIPTALQEYVDAPDDSYKYEVVGSEKIDGCTVHKLDLTSQTWQDIPWKHALYIYVPANVQHKQTVLLFITGGRVGGTPSGDDMKMAAKIAQAAAMPVAFVHQVPNQPLLGDKVEDDLISETFLRYVDSRDATWPLLFPMVKSATAAMTAVQDFGSQNYGVDVEQFVVTGGSKRGWTSWLTAVADDRVAGIAPIVIDTLNMPAQMKYQLETWGEYSEQIADYTSKGLVEVMENQPEIPLWKWVDPYTYRSVLTLPKLLINGTNDRYWTVDAMNVYWDDLQGEKHVRYVPNAGHGLDDGKEGALMTLAAFAQHVAEDKSLPELKWTHEGDDGEYRLTINSTPAPESVRLWVAKSDTKDFRNAKWEATELKVNDEAGGDGEEFVGVVEKPKEGNIALFGEATYRQGPLPYNLSTTLRRE